MTKPEFSILAASAGFFLASQACTRVLDQPAGVVEEIQTQQVPLVCDLSQEMVPENFDTANETDPSVRSGPPGILLIMAAEAGDVVPSWRCYPRGFPEHAFIVTYWGERP